MQTGSIVNRTIHIDGMTGDECVQKVSGVLKGIRGVTTHSVTLGSAAIGTDAAGCSNACAILETAGFRAREHSRGVLPSILPPILPTQPAVLAPIPTPPAI